MVDKSTTRMFRDLLTRQAGQQRVDPTALTRRAPASLPNVSPRGAAILNQIIGARTGGSSPAGGPLISKGGQQSMMASRADMMAAAGPVQQDSAWPTPPPGWGTQEEWDALTEPEREAVAGQVSQVVNSPTYAGRPDLRKRGVEGSPELQTRQYGADTRTALPTQPTQTGQPMWPGSYEEWMSLGPQERLASGYAPPAQAAVENIAPNVAQMGASDSVDWRVQQAVNQNRAQVRSDKMIAQPGADDIYGPASDVPVPEPATTFGPGDQLPSVSPNVYPRRDLIPDTSTPPTNWTGTPEEWAALPIENQLGVISAGMPEGADYNPVGYVFEAVVPEVVQDAGTVAGKFIWEQGGDDVTGFILSALDKPVSEVRSSTGEAAYYMATHNGERPPDDFFNLGSWIGSLTNVGGNLHDFSQWVYDTFGGDEEAAASAWLNLSILNYLDEHPEMYADIAKVYEDAIAAGASEQEAGQAVWTWFYEQKGLVAGFFAETIWDPLNLIPVAGWAGRRHVVQGVTKANEAATLENASLATKLAANTDQVVGRVLSAPQDVLDAAGAAPGKIIKRGWNQSPFRHLTEPAESVARADGVQAVDDAVVLARAEGQPRVASAEEARIRELIAKRNAERGGGQTNPGGGTSPNRGGPPPGESPPVGNTDVPFNAPDNSSPVDDVVKTVDNSVPVSKADQNIDYRRTNYTELTDDQLYMALRQWRDSPSSGAKVLGISDVEKELQRRGLDIFANPYKPASVESSGVKVPQTVDNVVDNVASDVDLSDVPKTVQNMAAGKPPAEIRAFWDDVKPMWDEWVAKDEAARAEVKAANDAAGISSKLDTPQRMLDEMRFQVGLEDAYVEHFGTPSSYTRTFKNKPGTEAGAIERAVFGTPEESEAAFSNLVEYARRSKTVNGAVVDELAQLRQRWYGEAGRMRPTDAVPLEPRSATPSAQTPSSPSTRIGGSTVEHRGKQFDGSPLLDDMTEDELRHMAVYGTADDIAGYKNYNQFNKALKAGEAQKGTARIARDRLRKLLTDRANSIDDPAERNAALQAVDDLMTQLKDERLAEYGPMGETINNAKAFNASRDMDIPSPDVLPIVNDPARQAKSHFKAWSARMDRIKAAAANPNTAESAAVPPPSEMKNWVDGAINEGAITKADRKHVDTGVEITVKRNGEDVKETWTFADRLGDNLSRQRGDVVERANRLIKKYKGVITDEQADEIVQTALKNFDDDYATALNKTKKEFIKAYTKADGKGPGRHVASAWNNFANFHRQNLQFNFINGTSAFMQDWFGNALNQFRYGEWTGLGNVAKIQRRFHTLQEGMHIDDVIPQGDFSRAVGVESPRKYSGGTFAKAQMEADPVTGQSRIWTESKPGSHPALNAVRFAFRPLAVPFTKRLRTFGDQAWRVATWHNAFKREMTFAQNSFLKRVRSYADELDDDSLYRDIARLGPDGGYSADDVRKVLRQHNIKDDTLARTWKEEINKRYDNATRKVDKIFFTYRKTKVDDALSQVFMFHYFMTRSAPQQIQYLMQHPGLLRAYTEYWDIKDEFANSAAPPWMKDWVQFWKGNGMYGMADFFSFAATFGWAMHLGEGGGYNDTTLEKVLNNTGLFFAPHLRAAFSTVGWVKPGDPLAMKKVNGAIIAMNDYLRNGGAEYLPDWVEERLPDFMTTPGFTDNQYQNFVDGFTGSTQRLAEQYGIPFANQLEVDSYMDKKHDEARLVLINTFEGMYGPRYDENGKILWEDDEVAEYKAAMDDLDDGVYNNTYTQEAITQVTKKDAANVVVDVASPVPSAVRLEDSDQRYQDTSEAWDRVNNNEPPEPQDKNLIETQEYNNLASDEARGLRDDYEGYQAVTKPAGNAGYIQITQDYENIPDNWIANIGGRQYTGAEIKAMSYEEREALGQQWVADQGRQVDPETLEALPTMAGYKAERGGMRDESPALDDFLTYRSWMFDFEDEPGGIREIRTGWEKKYPDSNFVKVITMKRQQLMDQGLYGEALEVRLDNWMKTEEAYAAIMGWGWKDDPQGPALFDPLSYPWRGEEESFPSSTPEQKVEPDVKRSPTQAWRMDFDAARNIRNGRGTQSTNGMAGASSFLQEFLGTR